MLLNQRGREVHIPFLPTKTEAQKFNREQILAPLLEVKDVGNHKCGPFFKLGTRATLKQRSA